MALSPGSRLGPYEIVGALGAGGMGEVYKARDARLDRLVAVKILPAAVAANPQLRDRFEREAKAVAAISHPNILAIHDVGQAGDVTFAVMELLDGETLRDRLKTAAPHGLTARKAIDYALQIAHGLAAAHEKGIVHRDLKPENIFITTDGRAKILDFGLAKQRVHAAPLATMTPTLAGGTTPGTILGTVGYMAPEQVRGLEVDHRADIFALGAVLYEMVAGRSPFQGDTTADTMSAILHKEPQELTHVDPSLPPALDRIVRRCLEKSAAERFHSAHDFAIALDAVAGSTGSSAAVSPSAVAPVIRRNRWMRWAGFAALFASGVALGAVMIAVVRPVPRATERLRLSVLPPDKIDVVGTLALSPGGRMLAFVGLDADSTKRLWLRRLDEPTPHVLAGTEDAAYPFWSPDGRSLGFFAQGRLKRLDLAGGMPRTLAPAAESRGGTWNAGGTIVFAPNPGDGLFTMSAQGGAVERLTTLDAGRQEISHRWPTFLPDGTHVLFMNRTPQPSERLALYVTAIEGTDAGKVRKLTIADSPGTYADGSLYFTRGSTLFVQPFDLRRLELTGEMTPAIERVWSDPSMDGLYAFSTAGGVFAFRDSETADSQLAWFDRSGKMLGAVGPAGANDPELSPDGRVLAYDVSDTRASGASTGVWTLDLDRGTRTRITPSSLDTFPTWSPDGKRIAFTSDRAGSFDLYEKTLGQTTDREVLKSPLWKYPESWSPDGRYLLFTELNPKSRTDLWVLPLDGGKATPFVSTDADEGMGRFSPDGRWITYASNESGRFEVYVRPFPLSDSRWQISVNGGSNPIWRSDGRELFYLALDNRVMSASMSSKGSTVEAGVPVELFKVRLARSTAFAGGDRFYAVTRGGDRFVVNQFNSDVRASTITVVVNR